MATTFIDWPHPYSDLIGPIAYSTHSVTEGKVRFFTIIRYLYHGNPAYQCFYRSSGSNSQVSGTWFPCDGYLLHLCEDKTVEEIIEKVVRTEFVKTTDFSSFETLRIVPDMLNVMHRFGCPLFLLISCVLSGGIWQNDSFAIHSLQHFFKTKYIRPSTVFVAPNCVVLSDMKDLNLFIGDAISVNFIKDQYSKPIDGTRDYREIITKERQFTIGAESPQFLYLQRRGFAKETDILHVPLFLTHNDKKIIPDFVIYDNLAKLDKNVFEGLMRLYGKSFRVIRSVVQGGGSSRNQS